jgi:hypothetical protein
MEMDLSTERVNNCQPHRSKRHIHVQYRGYHCASTQGRVYVSGINMSLLHSQR